MKCGGTDRIDRQDDGWIDGHMDKFMNLRRDGWMDQLVDDSMDGCWTK